MRRILLLIAILAVSIPSISQNLSFTCPRDTILGCNSACFTINAKIPDIRSIGSDYTLKEVSAASSCRPYVPPAVAGPSTNLTIDDRYSAVIPIGFNFPFYGIPYSSLVASTNGYLSFDVSLATTFADWSLATGNVPNTGYDPALIMGPWHDLDPSVTNSPTQQIKYNVVGTAPTRKWVLSFYKVPLFSGVCNALIENTHQIVLHESTGVIEVFIFDKQICASWNSGKAMVGLQDFTRTKAIMAPGRAATDAPWGSIGMNEVWRFYPTGGPTLYRSVQLLDGSGAVVATGDTTRVDVNTFETSFPNICPPAGNSIYVVKTTYQKIDDATSTIYSLDTINVIRQAALPVTATMTPTTCGANTGTVTVTASGTPPYQYSIDGGALQNSNVFTNIGSGVHTVYAVDATGCNNSTTITVTSVSSLPSTVVSANTSCPGLNNGSITVTPTLGTAPFTYSNNGGPTQPGGAFINLAPGTYTITFTDANGCTGTTAAITIATGTSITSTSTTTSTSCPGVNNGSTTVTATSGTAPYTYSIDGGATQPTGVFTGLAPGSHTVTITDVNGCTGTRSIFVFTGSGLTSTSSLTSATCPGVSNGSITITVTNGTAPFSFSLDGGPTQASGTFNGVASGSHTVTFTDATGCTGTRTVTVLAGSGIAGSASSTATACPGVSTGTVTCTPSSGVAPYTYSLDGGPSQASATFTGVAAGAHTISFTDANGCIGTATTTVLTGPGISGNVSSTATSCPTVNNGTVTVSPTTGTAPYTYSIDGGTSQAGATFSGIAAGLHTVTYQDANGCTGTLNVIVSAGVSLTGSATSTPTSCPTVNDGTVTATPNTGTGPYQYSLNGGPTQASATFTGLAPATYTITFTDAIGCSGTTTATVSAGANLTSTVAANNPPCANINDGIITITALTGVSPYQFSINGGISQTSAVFPGLAPGVYNIAFTDAIGCSGTNTITLTTNTPLTTTVNIRMPLCNGNANGIITLTPSGGVAPYEFSSDAGVNWQPSGTFNGLVTGVYTIRIRDNVGCIKDTIITLNEPPLLTASAISTPGTCNGNDGTIIVTPAGGTPGYQYSVNNGTSYQTSPNFVVSGGNYPDIKVKDSKGCIANTAVNVTLIDNMVLTPANDTTICVEQSVMLQPLVSVEASIFKWRTITDTTLVNTLDHDDIKNPVATPQDTTTYIVNAQWGICVREDTIVVRVLHKPIPYAGENVAVCNYKRDTILVGSATNLSGPVNFQWSPAETLQTPNQAVTIATPDSTQTYILTVTDDYGCNFSVTDDVVVTVQPPVPAYAGHDTIAVRGVPHQLMSSGGVGYEWTPAFPLNLSTAQNPLATLDNDQQFVVTVTDSEGCKGTDTVFIKVYNGPCYYVPSSFTPNGDGLNDIFRAIPVGISYTEWFRVFNRFGELVFQTNRWLKGWDGSYLGKKQPSGTYVWIIKGLDRNGKIVEQKGTVTIIQ